METGIGKTGIEGRRVEGRDGNAGSGRNGDRVLATRLESHVCVMVVEGRKRGSIGAVGLDRARRGYPSILSPWRARRRMSCECDRKRDRQQSGYRTLPAYDGDGLCIILI